MGYLCFGCKKELKLKDTKYICPHCGGNLDVVYDYRQIKKAIKRRQLENNPDRSIWRYEEILPLRSLKQIPPLQVGWTPLYPSRNLGPSLGLKHLYIKDDGRNPSASFKDRAGAVVIAHALQTGEKKITGASTGNAASSLACLSSVLGIRPVIFVPQTAPQAKIAQLLVFGATVITVRGTYDEAFDLCLKASDRFGWYNRNTGFNPFTREGKKTCSFEIIEQLGWKVPDWVFVSVGDGNILSGLWKGFLDFYRLGLIDRLPRLAAIQAEKSNAIAQALEGDGMIRPVSGETIADSISVSIPRDGVAAVRAIRESKGFALMVSDQEILSAIPKLARAEGVFAEPAGAATLAGLERAVEQGLVKSGDRVVCVVTGNGLKDVASAMKTVGAPFMIEPTIDAVMKLNLEY